MYIKYTTYEYFTLLVYIYTIFNIIFRCWFQLFHFLLSLPFFGVWIFFALRIIYLFMFYFSHNIHSNLSVHKQTHAALKYFSIKYNYIGQHIPVISASEAFQIESLILLLFKAINCIILWMFRYFTHTHIIIMILFF